jgi:hypothetical protein
MAASWSCRGRGPYDIHCTEVELRGVGALHQGLRHLPGAAGDQDLHGSENLCRWADGLYLYIAARVMVLCLLLVY